MGLSLGFVLSKTALIVQQRFSNCLAGLTERSSPFLLVILPWHWGRPGVLRWLEGSPSWPKGPIAYGSIPVYKAGGKKEEVGTFRVLLFFFPTRFYLGCSPRDGWRPAPPWDIVNGFLALLACASFTLPTELPLSQLTNFPSFTVQAFSPNPPWWDWVAGCVLLSCQLRLNHSVTALAPGFFNH